jgi:hypothetical protein
MTVRQHRLSSPAYPSDYIYPSDKDYPLNEDWEAGPIALLDTSEGLFNQAWHLTYAANAFTVTPEDTGPPVLLDLGSPVTSVQCGLAFDQNAHVTIAWIDAVNQGHLYWYDTTVGDWIVTDFQNPVTGIGLTLDDKRLRQTGASDILLWYTIPDSGFHDIYTREQRDRFATPYKMQDDPVWPYFKKLGMADELRVQMEMTTVGPV